MGVIKLEDIILVNIGTKLWLSGEVKKFTKKNRLGLIDMEKAVPLLTSIAWKLPLATHLKNRLVDVIEKIGYQLYLFLCKPFIDSDFQVDVIKWTADGFIHLTDTLRELVRGAKEYKMSIFKFSCETFEEKEVAEIWKNLARQQLDRHLDPRHIFYFYWRNKMEGKDTVPDSLAGYLIGFDGYRTLEANMFWHSVAVNNRAAIHYFHGRLCERELTEMGLSKCPTTEHSILEFVLKKGGEENFAFISSFLEAPILNEKAVQLIIDKMNPMLMKSFLDHVVRRVNICGNLHYNIFRYLLFVFRHEWTQEVRENLHFYALHLLSRGRLEKFEFLPDEDCKAILRKQIMWRIETKLELAIFVTIHWNNYTHLLSEFLHWLADNEEDKHFFRNFLSAIVDGNQYDLPTKPTEQS